MTEEEFQQLASEEWSQVPERWRSRIENVALLIEAAPSPEVRESESLGEHDTLLGLYRGVPNSERGSEYGIGVTLPDTITLYREPILKAAEQDHVSVREVLRETLWHEIGHYFGFADEELEEREDKGTNAFHN